jgi:dehydration protein DpgD
MTSDQTPLVTYEREGHVSVITLRRPQRHNAITSPLMIDLARCWTEFAEDDEAWVAVITGEGRSFSSGMDIADRVATDQAYLAVAPDWPYNPFMEEHLDKPTIAAVRGYAFGGGFYFASRCDLRVASETAVFQITEPVRGGLAGYELLELENLPYAVVAELVTGRRMNAQRAYEVGLVNQLVRDDQLMDVAMGWAHELCDLPPLALHYNMKLLRDIRRDRSRITHTRQMELDAMWKELNASEDTREAFQAFVEKRQPVYRRR